MSMEVSVPQQATFLRGSRLRTWGKTEGLLFLLVSLYVYSAWLITQAYERPEAFRGLLYVPVSELAFGVVLGTYVIARTLWIMICWRPYYLIRTLRQDFAQTFFTPHCLFSALPLAALFCVFFGAFSSMKSMIPVINPYSWDPAFAELDQLLHGGVHPWVLLHHFLGYPRVTTALNFIYNFWLFLLLFMFFWQVFTPVLPRLRLQFLLTFFLAWIVIGHILATIFSSAGPCYYGLITRQEQNNPYVALLTYLQQASAVSPVWVLNTQAELWQMYQAHTVMPGAGISAMPSMHVAMAALFTFFAFHLGRWYHLLFTTYLMLIVLGSVHLAWHYAIDAYVAILLTYGIWRCSGRIVRYLENEEDFSLNTL